MNKNGKAWGDGLTEDAVWHVVRQYARKAWIEREVRASRFSSYSGTSQFKRLTDAFLRWSSASRDIAHGLLCPPISTGKKIKRTKQCAREDMAKISVTAAVSFLRSSASRDATGCRDVGWDINPGGCRKTLRRDGGCPGRRHRCGWFASIHHISRLPLHPFSLCGGLGWQGGQ